jgi:hypothetical protein
VKTVISPVIKVLTTNLMEDEDEELYILHDSCTTESECTLSLSFRGYEGRMVKLIIGTLPSDQPPEKSVSLLSFDLVNVSV